MSLVLIVCLMHNVPNRLQHIQWDVVFQNSPSTRELDPWAEIESWLIFS
jgi:hypothetical protein